MQQSDSNNAKNPNPSQQQQPSQQSARPAQQGGADPSQVQGEGDYEAARRYDRSAREFAQSGKVQQAAQQARPEDAQTAQELQRAEEVGKSHSKGEDAGSTSPRQP